MRPATPAWCSRYSTATNTRTCRRDHERDTENFADREDRDELDRPAAVLWPPDYAANLAVQVAPRSSLVSSRPDRVTTPHHPGKRSFNVDCHRLCRSGKELRVKVGTARAIATRWVHEFASTEPNFRGAYFSGSTLQLSDDDEMPRGSDVDVMIVMGSAKPAPKLGKFAYRGALLEVTRITWGELAVPEDVLGSYHLAGSFAADSIISDPTGWLTALRHRTSRDFSSGTWVRARCADARQRILGHLSAISPAGSFHQQVTSWLFGTGVTTHVLLVAALRNPTIRLRYPAARGVLRDYRMEGHYRPLLQLLGCSDLTSGQVERHLRALARTFDTAASVAATPFFFSSDITPIARPVAIDGSRELIDRGDHREAMFWILATFARCHTILAADAPREHRAMLPDFLAAAADLGIHGPADIPERASRVVRFIPDLWRTAELIIAANTAIVE